MFFRAKVLKSCVCQKKAVILRSKFLFLELIMYNKQFKV